MPENIDGLLSSFGIDPNSGTQTEATAEDNSTDTEATETETAEPETDNTESSTSESEKATETETQSNVQAQLDNENANRAFAAMRAENSKYKKLMNTLMRGSNFNGDEQAFIDLLTNESYKQQAKLQGMAANPELLKKMDQQEEQIRQLTESQRDQALMIGLKTLQQNHNLTGKEVEMFVQRAIDNRIDLLAPGVNFDTLYKGMFFDDIIKKQIEEERQKWIKQSNKSANAATPDGKSGKQDPAKTDVKTMTELNSLLNTVSKDLSK
jgi:hypothetical protein